MDALFTTATLSLGWRRPVQKSVDRGFAAISVLGQSRSEHVLSCFRIVPIACESACHGDNSFEGHCHSICSEIGEFGLDKLVQKQLIQRLDDAMSKDAEQFTGQTHRLSASVTPVQTNTSGNSKRCLVATQSLLGINPSCRTWVIT